MFKKAFLFLSVMGFVMPVAAAELTHPFYMPGQYQVSSVTSLDFGWEHYKNSTRYNQRYHKKTIDESLAFGLTDTIAVTGSVANVWNKIKDAGGSSDKDDKNIDFTVGAKWNAIHESALKAQLHIVYGQREHWADHGAYKYTRFGGRAGYETKWFMPYASAEMEVPLWQSRLGHDRNRYEARLGAYKTWNNWSLDADMRYNSDPEYKQNALAADAEVSYALTPSWTVGAYGHYVLAGRQKWDGDSYGKKVGLRLRTVF